MNDRIHHALCQTLAGNPDRVDWPAFTPDDWQRLIGTAQAHRVAPLLYHVLEGRREKGDKETRGQGGSPPLPLSWSPPLPSPPSILHKLRAAYYATAAHNLLIHQELARILQAISNSQFTVHNSQLAPILLKGIALGLTLYPDQALRPLSDIDLLLPRAQLDAAVKAVQSLGYRKPTPEMAAGHNEAAGHHMHLRGGPKDSIAVELHWNLVGSDTDWRTPPMDWFWEQTEALKMSRGAEGQRSGGARKNSPLHLRTPAPPLTLTPTAHLLYLAAHLMLQHGAAQARLIWYYDHHLLITRQGHRLDPSTGSGLRWDELLARAQEFRWAPALHAALQGTQERFGTPLPAGVLDTLAETQDQQAARSVARKAGPIQSRAVRTWDTLAAKSWRARLHHAWTLACPSPEYVRWRYQPQPAWLWPLYYPYRWFDILRDGLTTLWRTRLE